jgi:predicted TIM-barrel fold metal-dependent hydrolase
VDGVWWNGEVAAVVDCDQHLYEPRGLWAEHIDPERRDDALAVENDEAGYAWLTWRGQRIQLADVQFPGDTLALGEWRQRRRRGEPPAYAYDEALPEDYWHPSARADRVAVMGLDAAVVFPNFGLLWERALSGDLPALTANMTAWNRWCAAVAADGRGRLLPVAHLTLRDPGWLEAELAALGRAGVRLAMIAPALVDGRPLSHPDHDRAWAAFVEHGVTPVFHVADQPRLLDEGWFTDPDEHLVSALESVFLWAPPAVALADLILNGTFDRHPSLRVGVIELSAVWVPLFQLMLDGGTDFTARLNGRPLVPLRHRPSEYLAQHVRIAAFSYEGPARLTAEAGDLFMACSDYPHSEGTADPLADYRAAGCDPDRDRSLFADNLAFLLGTSTNVR